MYSDMIEHAAAVLSAENGWTLSKASEYIEDLIFNSNADIPSGICGRICFTESIPVRSI